MMVLVVVVLPVYAAHELEPLNLVFDSSFSPSSSLPSLAVVVVVLDGGWCCWKLAAERDSGAHYASIRQQKHGDNRRGHGERERERCTWSWLQLPKGATARQPDSKKGRVRVSRAPRRERERDGELSCDQQLNAAS